VGVGSRVRDKPPSGWFIVGRQPVVDRLEAEGKIDPLAQSLSEQARKDLRPFVPYLA